MHHRRPRLCLSLGLPALLFAAAAFCSCGPRTLGFAVVLWGASEGPANGTALPVVARSAIDKTVTLWDQDSGRRLRLEGWRVREFPGRSEAERYAASLASYRDGYAFTDRTAGLPIREKPDPQARRLYKVAPGQLMRVLGRSAEKATEGTFQDYWYEILTDDGYAGYCFGYFLRTFSAPLAEARGRMEQMLAEDPVLDKLFSEVWRPEYFVDMIASGRIDLARFSADVGLFPDRQGSAWTLHLFDFDATVSYERVERPVQGVYTFPPSDFRIVVHSGDRLEVSYRREGKTARTVFVPIRDEEVAGEVERERERRRELLDAFLGRGGVLKSTAYGTIEIDEEGEFRWSEYGRVPAGVFSRPVSGAGRLDFPCRIAPGLRGSYDGAVSFIFDEYHRGEQTVFLYSFTDSGVQLSRVAAADIQDLEVQRVGVSPLVMYFGVQDR